MRPALVIMLKEPRPGRVKTRLGDEIGTTAAAWWYRHHSVRLIRRLTDPRWEMILAVNPDREGLHSRVWPRHPARRVQGRGDLGDRMQRLFRAAGRRPVCLIGSDIAGLDPAHIMRAFRELGSSDIVFGPAPDGGFWLVGIKNGRMTPRPLFHGARWSSGHALTDSVASVPGLRVAYVDQLHDIDTADDLRMTTGGTRAT